MSNPATSDPVATGGALASVATPAATLADSPFLRVATRRRPARTPVWFMRQAGRSLPEYRDLRVGVGMLESCMRPDLVTEITLQPVRRHGVDAAILFSDIVLPLKAIGIDLDIVAGVGPVVAEPIRDAAGVAAVRALTPDDVDYIAEAVRLLVAELGGVPLIGFAGAPFTLASYLIEGGPSRNHEKTKALMLSEPALWHDLMARLADVSAAFLDVQIRAGASAVQLFDSWAGALPKTTYEELVQPHSARIFDAVGDRVPRIHFGVGTALLLPSMRDAGADVVGVDWRLPLDQAVGLLGPDAVVQGNLDPAVLFADWPVIEREVRRVLAEGRAAAGHIFNLGHGVLPETDPSVITRVVELVHEVSAGGDR